MKLTKSQEQVISYLERNHNNPLKSLDSDCFTEFEVKGFDFDEDFNTIDVAVDGKGKTGDLMVNVKSVSELFLDRNEYDSIRDMVTNKWMLLISKRGKVEAFQYPDHYKSGETTWTGIHIN
jgi:hypothetical protein